MKTNFERIEPICNSGKIALIETHNLVFPYVSIIKTFGEVYRISQPQRTKEKALENIGYKYADLEEINELDIKSITPINYPPHNIEVGDKVRILENAAEPDENGVTTEEAKELIGKVFEVKKIHSGERFQVWDKKNDTIYLLHLHCICLDWED